MPRHDNWPRNTHVASANSCGDDGGRSTCRPTRFGLMSVPEHLRYSSDHEWVSIEGTRARVGITDYAQDALGDVVFVQIPRVGVTVALGDTMSEVESTKSVSDIYAPVSGTIVAVNESLADHPETLNADPYGDGWICDIEMTVPDQSAELLDAAGYSALVEG